MLNRLFETLYKFIIQSLFYSMVLFNSFVCTIISPCLQYILYSDLIKCEDVFCLPVVYIPLFAFSLLQLFQRSLH